MAELTPARLCALSSQSALNDHFKRVVRLRKSVHQVQSEIEEMGGSGSASDTAASTKYQLSCKITIKLGGKTGGGLNLLQTTSTSATLAPPPPSSFTSPAPVSEVGATSISSLPISGPGKLRDTAGAGDVDWGDFQ